LTTTTLRFASTNEVATLNNASLANSRIVNHARSAKASVSLRIKLNVDTNQRQLEDFRIKMEGYLEDQPRKWVGLIHYRQEQIDSDNGFIFMLYRAQHAKPWQEMAAIMIHKGEWERYADTVATEMGIGFDSPPNQMAVGLGLAPERDADKATDDRARVAAFIRSINLGGNQQSGTENTGSTNETSNTVSEYFGDGAPPGVVADFGAFSADSAAPLSATDPGGSSGFGDGGAQ